MHPPTGAIIPAQTHRIPSELSSLACLHESSTRMCDLLRALRVAPLMFFFSFVSSTRKPSDSLPVFIPVRDSGILYHFHSFLFIILPPHRVFLFGRVAPLHRTETRHGERLVALRRSWHSAVNFPFFGHRKR